MLQALSLFGPALEFKFIFVRVPFIFSLGIEWGDETWQDQYKTKQNGTRLGNTNTRLDETIRDKKKARKNKETRKCEEEQRDKKRQGQRDKRGGRRREPGGRDNERSNKKDWTAKQSSLWWKVKNWGLHCHRVNNYISCVLLCIFFYTCYLYSWFDWWINLYQSDFFINSKLCLLSDRLMVWLDNLEKAFVDRETNIKWEIERGWQSFFRRMRFTLQWRDGFLFERRG